MVSRRKAAMFVFEDLALSMPRNFSPCWSPLRLMAFHLPFPNCLSSYFFDIFLESSPLSTWSSAVSYTSLSRSDGSDLCAVASFHASASSSFSSEFRDYPATSAFSGKMFEATTKPATLKPLVKRVGSCQSRHLRSMVSAVSNPNLMVPAAISTDWFILHPAVCTFLPTFEAVTTSVPSTCLPLLGPFPSAPR